ncbi:flotillin family protein [Deinococcus cellulosilyticus]|uniref:Flotillin n=1 Tax=Deinococcus cellulosilyticus (strain DSM 18568 / NBRC 106333 / KACC 11606 / 5516J-15) TaxID=1223518 RepID=A0A511N5W9_DEIC1|nr:flotillin family protein [Deinococcus cellulosilyticus]GEM47801.1 flotillin [Deinococcus cellulosilyticus NBRC 106333 = KACC 11606]
MNNLDLSSLLVIVGLVVIAVVFVVILVKNFLIVVPPNRVLVISGRRTAQEGGDSVGYRVIRGGRAFRVPVLEQINWMDLNTIPLDLTVQNAYSKGGIPLTVHAVANVKVNAREPYLSNAIERFLEVKREQITQITKDTLEGNLRGIIATLTPEEINEDRLRFAEALIEEAEHDMHKIGMQLDTLKIQNVSDESGYLDSIGRRRTAEVLKEARIAEAERNAEATQAEAGAQQRSQVSQAQAQQAIIEEQNKLRVRTAELNAVAVAKENEAAVAGERARVIAEQELEHQRIVLNQKRLEADVITPARAQREASLLEAQADAAPIIEEGRAKAEAFRLLVEAFNQAGVAGERAFILNMMPTLVKEMADAVRSVKIDKLNVIDSGNGEGFNSTLHNLPKGILSLLDQVETTTGVDLLSTFKRSAEQHEARTEGKQDHA